MQRLCGRIAPLITDPLAERTIVERLAGCDALEVLAALRVLEQWGLLNRFLQGGDMHVRWRDQSVAAIAPKVLPLLDERVDELARLGTDRDCPVHVVVALPMEEGQDSGGGHLRPLRLLAAGRGTSLGNAILGGLAEAAETISAMHRGNEATVQAPFAQLGQRAVRAGDLLLFSSAQYRERGERDHRRHGGNEVPPPVDDATHIDWVEARALHDAATWQIPAACCYLRYRWKTGDIPFCQADTNGCAVGATRDHAILKALLELVERDAVAIWWYNRLQRHALDLDDLGQATVLAMRAWLENCGRSLHVLDLSGDLPIFVAAAISAELPGQRIAFGFGSHFDPAQAVLAAVMEMHQFFAQATLLERLEREGRAVKLSSDVVDMMTWWRGQSLAYNSHLVPSEISVPRVPYLSGHVAPETAVARLVEELRRRGLTPLVLDITRADLDVPAVRVVVPGLRPWWARFAPGRLYQIPVALRWLAHPLAEDDLNPVPMFI
ncbi:MAG TPA: YcaO-like family protein [Candidatus Acidoferrum sp.]|nr:YcaO-like family protein [Candidatus Acidoferrum sp.]